MINPIQKSVLFFLAFFLHSFLSAQNFNVIVKCSVTTPGYLLNSKNKIKSSSHFEVSKINKSGKKLQSKVWYTIDGCAAKSFYYSPGNIFGGNYGMTISEFNEKGYRTKFEEYKFDKDSVPVLTFSENVLFDSYFRLLEKNSQYLHPKKSAKSVIESYNYNQPDFKIIATEKVYENNGFPKTIKIFKYNSSFSETPEEKEISNYSDSLNYTTSLYVKDKFNEFKTVKNGVITVHQKNIFEKNSLGYAGKSVLMDMLSGKKIQETINHSEHEYTVINYDKQGNKISEYTDHIPYGLSPENEPTFDFQDFDQPSTAKNDTIQLKNGNKKVIIYENNYPDNNKLKISQTLEYNNKMLLMKNDVEVLKSFSEYYYEYYP